MANATITPEVQKVLNDSTLTGLQLKLPDRTLDRKLYLDVKKVLELAGGKWKTGPQAFVFDKNPSEKLGLAMASGTMIDTKKVRQAFYTPPELATQVVAMAKVSGNSVLEPSAGGGALVKECLALGASGVHCMEIDEEAADGLRAQFKGQKVNVVTNDFLARKPSPAYQRIVMNPPFTKNADCSHVEHALKFLIPKDGILTAIMLDNQSRPKFNKLLEGRTYEITPVPAGTFKESGTGVATIILQIFT